MPVTLTHIARNTATATLLFGDDPATESLNVVYHPLLITSEMLSHLQSFNPGATGGEAVAQMEWPATALCAIIEKWDLLEDDGTTVIPLTKERLLKLSPLIHSLVINAILGSLVPETLAPQMNGAH